MAGTFALGGGEDLELSHVELKLTQLQRLHFNLTFARASAPSASAQSLRVNALRGAEGLDGTLR